MLIAGLIGGAALVADLGPRRSLYLGLATALTPVEPDTRERALLIAAGAGQVATVRSLLAAGVRAEPEAFTAAVTGIFEPVYSWSGCERHAEVTLILLAANPRLRPANNARGNVVRNAARIRGCTEVSRLLAN